MRGMRNSKRKTTDEKAREILAQGLFGVLSCRCDDRASLWGAAVLCPIGKRSLLSLRPARAKTG